MIFWDRDDYDKYKRIAGGPENPPEHSAKSSKTTHLCTFPQPCSAAWVSVWSKQLHVMRF